jgi:trigger factor
LEIDIDKASEGDIAKACNILNLAEEDKEKAKGVFTFTITEIKRRKEAELNEDLFQKAFPDKNIKTEKELRQVIAETHSQMCDETVSVWFFNECFEPILQNANLQFNDEMLRQYMEHQKRVNQRDEEQEADDEISGFISEEEYEKIKKGTSWQLIQQKMMATFDIKVEPDEIKQAAKEQISRYFGIDPKQADAKLGEYMDSLVGNIMKDKKQVEELYVRALDKKIVQVLKENTQMTTKEVTWEDFIKIAEKKKDEASTVEQPKTKKPSTKKPKKENTEQQSLFE